MKGRTRKLSQFKAILISYNKDNLCSIYWNIEKIVQSIIGFPPFFGCITSHNAHETEKQGKKFINKSLQLPWRNMIPIKINHFISNIENDKHNDGHLGHLGCVFEFFASCAPPWFFGSYMLHPKKEGSRPTTARCGESWYGSAPTINDYDYLTEIEILL